MRQSTATLAIFTSAILLALGMCGASASAPGSPESSETIKAPDKAPETPAPASNIANHTAAEAITVVRLDALAFFDQLVAHYRGLTAYSDLTRIIQTTRHYDEREPQRVETEVSCDFFDGELLIETAASQLRRGLGLDVPFRMSPELEQVRSSYDIWLLPHMALKFSEKPLEEFREGVSEGFTATEAAEVTIDDRPMVHLELTSGDGLSGDYNARYDLYVDPDSMLIERIEGRQRMPDGGDFETTYHITPKTSEGGAPVITPAEAVSTTDDRATTPSRPCTPKPGPAEDRGTASPDQEPSGPSCTPKPELRGPCGKPGMTGVLG